MVLSDEREGRSRLTGERVGGRDPERRGSQYVGEKGRGATGMPGFGGSQGGRREICNWITAWAVADGHKSTAVDYIPVYGSPVGVAFSYCTVH